MESSILLSGPLKGVFRHFKVERRVLTSGTVLFNIPEIVGLDDFVSFNWGKNGRQNIYVKNFHNM